VKISNNLPWCYSRAYRRMLRTWVSTKRIDLHAGNSPTQQPTTKCIRNRPKVLSYTCMHEYGLP